MSIKLMNAIWDHSPYKGSKLLILLSLADMANDAGKCWPSIPTISRRARLTERQTMIVLAQLRADQAIDWDNRPGTSNMYAIANPAPLNPDSPLRPDSGVPLRPDSPPPESRFTPPLNPDSPKPLLNHQVNQQTEPSLKPPLLPTNPETNQGGGVVVVGRDGLEWPLRMILNTAGRDSHQFRNPSEAKTFTIHWLYAITQKTINNPVFYALSRVGAETDPRYAEIVEAGPSQIVYTEFGGNDQIKAIRQAGGADLLAAWLDLPDQAPAPDPEPEPEAEPAPPMLAPQPSPIIYHKNGLGTAPNIAWDAVMGQMQLEMPRAAYVTWAADLVLLDYNPDQQIFTVGAPNILSRDWVESRLSATVSRMLTGVTNKSISLNVITWADWKPSEQRQTQQED